MLALCRSPSKPRNPNRETTIRPEERWIDSRRIRSLLALCPCPCWKQDDFGRWEQRSGRKEGRTTRRSREPQPWQIPHPARSSRGSPWVFSPSFSHKDVKAGSALALARRQALIINTRGGARQSGGRQASACFSSGRPAGKRDETASGGLPASRTWWRRKRTVGGAEGRGEGGGMEKGGGLSGRRISDRESTCRL